MIEQQAKVIEIKGNIALVDAASAVACAQCASGKGCGAGVFSGFFKKSAGHIHVLNTLQAKVGDSVTVGLDENAFLKGVFYIYMLPLLAMLFFALIGDGLAGVIGLVSKDILALLFAVVGLVLGLLYVRYLYAPTIGHDSDNKLQAVMMKLNG